MINPFETIKPIEAYQREAEEFEARKRQRMMEEQLTQGKLSMLPFEQQKMQAEVKALQEGRGANVPATIQIANEMQRALASGDTARYNMLNQVHKTMDRGLQVDPTTGQIVPMQGYGPAIGAISADKAGMSRQAEKNVDIVMNPQIAGGEAEAKLLQQLSLDPAIKRAVSLAEGEAAAQNEAQKEIRSAAQTEPLIGNLREWNKQSPEMAYAELQQPFRRLTPGTSSEEASVDLMRQARLELAAPLAKQLGVNPTDKDLQASLDRIFDLNSTQESRQKQIDALEQRILLRKKSAQETVGIQLDTPAPAMQPMDKYSQEEAQFNERKGKKKTVRFEDLPE